MRTPFLLKGSRNLFLKYQRADKDITVYIRQGKELTSKILFWDDYAVKLILPDERITIPIHSILYCKFDHFVMENEALGLPNAFRGLPRTTGRENAQIDRYEKKQNLLHFYLEDDVEVKGRLKWHLPHVYCVRPDEEVLDYFIHKRHILYYKEIRENKVLLDSNDSR